MKRLRDWLSDWKLTGLKIKVAFLNLEFKPGNADKLAAWDLYVELLTRVSTQFLEPYHGDEKRALTSIYELFELTRGICKQHGPEASEFTKIAIIVLNQIIRPFTAKWHRLSLAGAFDKYDSCKEFRKELEELQIKLRRYTQLLAAIADVEDLTELEEE